jgi:hypothetical protein
MIIKRAGKHYWEFKIFFRDPFTNKIKSKRRRGFRSKEEAQASALEMMELLRAPL